MASADPMANNVAVTRTYNVHSVNPENMSQVPQYLFNQPQVCQNLGNQGLEMPADAPPAQTTFKEGKTLGALQILIGLIHIGLGSILGTFEILFFIAVSFIGGYPFWGGILFIISGSLSVASEHQPRNPCLLKGSLGMNIVSAIFSVIGIFLFIADILISLSGRSETTPARATSGVLLIFSLLQLCIASTCAHFGCQLVSRDTTVYQTIYVTNQVATPKPVDIPPSYSSEVQQLK